MEERLADSPLISDASPTTATITSDCLATATASSIISSADLLSISILVPNTFTFLATKSFVLLKNNQGTLPLKKSGTIALIGPLANNKANMLGTWAVSGNRDLSIPVFDGSVP